MYSLIRVWIGSNEARIADPGQRRGEDHERDRQAVDAELVLDAEDGDPVVRLDELELLARRDRAVPVSSSSETTHVASAKAKRQRPRPAARQDGDHDRADERQERDDRSGSATATLIRGSPPGSGTSRPSPAARARCPARSSGPGRSGRGGGRGRRPRSRRPMALTVPSTTTRSNHHRACASRPPMTMNSRWLSSSNHHLLSDARYRNDRPGRAAISRTDSGQASRRAGRSRRRSSAMPTTMPIAATATLARISQPSMPNSSYRLVRQREHAPRPPRRPARASGERALAERADPAPCRGEIDGMASRMSGTVMTGGDSWMRSQTAFGPRNAPQNVRPMSRNM